MKTKIVNSFMAGLVVGLAVSASSETEAVAQLNEDKVLRDASGVYQGTAGGGVLLDLDNPANPAFTPTKARGKSRVNFRKGKQRGSTTNSRFAGDDRVDIAGAFNKIDVKRAGELIAVEGKGTAEEDNEQFDLWRNGKATGTVVEKGQKWKGNGVMGGTREFFGDPGNIEDDFTEKFIGLRVEGTH